MQGMNINDFTNFYNKFIMFILSHHRAIYSDGEGHNNGEMDKYSLLCIYCAIIVHMVIIMAIVHEVSFWLIKLLNWC